MQRTALLLLTVVMLALAACEASPVDTRSVSSTSTRPMTSSPDPAFPEPTTAVTISPPTTASPTTLPPVTTSEPRVSQAGCVTTPGALQELIDAAPDGENVSDMKGKLRDATSLGFSVLDLSATCYEDQGTITLDGRYGLWLVRPATVGTDWILTEATDTVLSGIDIGDGSLTIRGGNQRIEAGEIGDLSISGVTDFMMGKMTIRGHAHFDSMTRVDSDKSFVRNTSFGTVEITGDIDGFKIENSTADSLDNHADTSSGLSLDLVVR